MSIIFNGHYRMKHRTWITEALRLHFEEHLPRVVAGRRLGVPKSTVCSMFVRFRRAGLSWPLPAGMSEQELDACLYGQFSTVPVVRPESTVISEAPVVKKRPRRPNFPYEFKIALVEQSLQPGACVAQIARENGINDNLLFNWRHQYRKGVSAPSVTSCDGCPVWQQSRPSILMDTNDEFSDSKRYHRLSLLFARRITSKIRRAIICPGYRPAVRSQSFHYS
nr:IS66-like element accessory protein TnpA [Escherichia coli]